MRMKFATAMAACGLSLLLVGCGTPAAPSTEGSVESPVADAENGGAATESPAGALGEPGTTGAVVETPTPAVDAKILLGSPELTAGISGDGPLTVEQVRAWLDDPKNHERLEFELPMGLREGAAQVKGVAENPLTRAKIELGRQLYFDPRLSAADISCASCHHPDEGFAKHTQFGVGINGQMGGRNSPVSYNRILSDVQFWDGRAATLEAQAVGPIANPIEMGNTHEACVKSLAGIEGYVLQFEKVFGELTIDAVAKAIASFERAIVTGPTPYDYQKALDAFAGVDLETAKEDDPELYAAYEEAKAAAEAHAMSDSAKRGMPIYFTEKGNCSACHVGANLTDELYYNIGVGMDKENFDKGRAEISKDEKDTGAFKTPTIRNIVHTAPYMHDGSQKTLEEVVDWYAKGGHPNPFLHQRIKKLDLTDQDKKDIVEFMKACSGDFPKVATGRLPQ